MRRAGGSAGAAVALVLGILGSGPAWATDLLLSVCPGGAGAPRAPDPNLRWVDPANGTTVDSVPITLAGFVVTGATGLARQPGTGTLFAMLKIQGTSFRRLVTLDEFTGVATDVGDTGKRFAGLAFSADGTLYAITGDGDGIPESLFVVSTADGTSQLLIELGSGTDGEALAYSPDDGLLYRASGIGMPNNPNGEKFETIDPGTLNVSTVTLSGFDYEELTALTFENGGFFAGDLGSASVDMPRLFRITPTGAVTLLGDMDHVSKGLAPAAAPPAVPAVPLPAFGLLGTLVLAIGRLRLRGSTPF